MSITQPDRNDDKSPTSLTRERPQSEKQGKRKESWYKTVQKAVCDVFKRHGELVGRHPLPFILLPIIVLGSLGFGIFELKREGDFDILYFPANSRAINERDKIKDLFPNLNKEFFNPLSQSKQSIIVGLLFITKNGANLFGDDDRILQEIREIVESATNISASGYSFKNICARNFGKCVVDGGFALNPYFKLAVRSGQVSYPVATLQGRPIDLASSISGVTLSEENKLISATVLKISFVMLYYYKPGFEAFGKFAADLKPSHSDVYYALPNSLDKELEKTVQGDIKLFALSITLSCVYASFVSIGGDVVSSRAFLALGGILAAGLGILGSIGLLALCGVKFVDVVGTMPFLIIGIGVDDMFLLMSSWSEEMALKADSNDRTVPIILGRTLSSAALGVTITSLTDLIAFLIGATSIFLSIRNFSLYVGVAIFLCYVANLTLFSGCLAIHGRRVLSSRSTLTCRPVRDKEELRAEGRSWCYRCWCGGSIPKEARDDESFCEIFPRWLLPKVVQKKAVCVVIIVLFCGYLAAAIYGTVHLKEGLKIRDLSPTSSYYNHYIVNLERHFAPRTPVAFVVDKVFDYQQHGDKFLKLLNEARNDTFADSEFLRCWMVSFHTFLETQNQSYKRLSTFYYGEILNTTLAVEPQFYQFKADVAFGKANKEQNKFDIVASRCFIASKPSNDLYAKKDLMVRLRKLADNSDLPVFVYHWTFVSNEQFIAILPATLKLVGCAVLSMALVTFAFLPHVLMVSLVMLTILMIQTGIFGFMYYWGITLSAITMIHLVMSVGFSVDFSIHVCAAYLISDSLTRQARARDAIYHAASPILNGAASTLVGVVVLAGSNSYPFFTFFKIMLLVIGFGLLHSVLFLPAVLALVGPQHIPDAESDLHGRHSQQVSIAGVQDMGDAVGRQNLVVPGIQEYPQRTPNANVDLHDQHFQPVPITSIQNETDLVSATETSNVRHDGSVPAELGESGSSEPTVSM